MSEGEVSNTWKYVGIGCGIVALIALCSVGSCALCFGGAVSAGIAALEPPVEATRGFLTQVRAGDAPGAYAQTSQSYRATHTVEQFTAALASMPELAASYDQTISQRNVQAGQGATMGGNLHGPSGNTGFTAELVEEEGVWRISTLRVGAATL